MSSELVDAIEAAAQDLAEGLAWEADRAGNPLAQRPSAARDDVMLLTQAFQRTLSALFLLVTEAQGGA